MQHVPFYDLLVGLLENNNEIKITSLSMYDYLMQNESTDILIIGSIMKELNVQCLLTCIIIATIKKIKNP